MGELRRSGKRIALEAQPAKALALLLEKAGDVVSRDDLRSELWDETTHVDFDRGIAYCISQIRSALQDSGANPRFVQTIPKQGFRLLVPVERLDQAKAWPRRNIVLAALGFSGLAGGIEMIRRRLRRRVIGVSIFDNETGRADLDRWVASLSDVVVASLTALGAAKIAVIGNAAALRQTRNIRNLKTLAREVRADYVVLGQLQNQDDGLRFITHLIRLEDEVHLQANRISWNAQDLSGFERAVVAEFEHAVRKHVLDLPS